MPTLTAPSTVSFPLQIDQILTLTTNFGTGNVTLSAQKSGDIVYSYNSEQMQEAPVFSPGSQGIVTITHLTGSLTYNVTTSAFPLFENTPRVLFQSAIPFILAGGTAGGGTNQFTCGVNGAISDLQTQPDRLGIGAWLYLPANSITASNPLGWYWFVASSTTAGTVYNNRYISGDPKLAVPTVLTPFVSAAQGLKTQTTGSSITGPSIVVPANTLGPNGLFRANLRFEANNNANSKVFSISFGAGSNLAVNAANGVTGGSLFEIRAINSTNRQMVTPRSGGSVFSMSGNPAVYAGDDLTVAQTFNVTLNMTTASDFMALVGVDAIAQYGA